MEVPKMSVEDSYNSGCQKGEMQDWRGALNDYNSVIYSNEYIPKNVEISTYLNRGIAYYYIGSPSAAIEDWKKVIELASDDPNKRAKARNLIETVKRERGGY
jgi:tetratricopeptide (TPR) repeat protein